MRMMTVDDSSVVRKIIRAASGVLEYELEEAESGLEALEILEKFDGQIDLILLDWNMPGMNGYELLQKIKSTPKYKNIPVMMVTTEGQKENIVMAVKAGAAHYMTKPFAMEDLIKRILECMGKGAI
ncbi:response regulator [Pseudobacteroides cellulosolvens]|uniref:Stage 0 sporulation protein A homolog n=1 Tax=Pseudobacteroides cellulosolvens ATCC 35603 = DSM 2933 TaxID=398512 RepID=A0A0L6JV04_9FIRM|nr:response regulator [Pseudobacteroides cellulosolvens]KNY29554.1 response regulator receiver protein [Pseudobacteroides cellulosolvens ATCC 35603 = DSM 2933]